MTQTLPSRAEIEGRLIAARQRVLEAEDSGDWATATQARERCDQLTDQWAHTTEPT